MSLSVTCIIPCHNAADTIVKAIESAIDQCDQVVVIDDASTKCDPLESSYLKFKKYDIGLTRTGSTYPSGDAIPSGVCHARNVGIDFADIGLILPLDADDWLVEGAVQKLKDAYKPGHFVYGNWYEVQNNEEKEQRPPPVKMIRKKNIGYASFMFHKDDWQAAGGYQPHFNIGGEHWAFMASLIYTAKVKPVYIDTPIFHYDRTESKRYGRANRFHSTIQKMVGEIIDGH